LPNCEQQIAALAVDQNSMSVHRTISLSCGNAHGRLRPRRRQQ
jgi:hypothetical protein